MVSIVVVTLIEYNIKYKIVIIPSCQNTENLCNSYNFYITWWCLTDICDNKVMIKPLDVSKKKQQNDDFLRTLQGQTA